MISASAQFTSAVGDTPPRPRARPPRTGFVVAATLAALAYLAVTAGGPTTTLDPDVRNSLVATALREGAANGDPHPSAEVYVLPSDAPCRAFFTRDVNGYCADAKYMLVVRGDFLSTRCLRSVARALRYPHGEPSNEVVVALDGSAAPLLRSCARTRGPRPHDWGPMTSL